MYNSVFHRHTYYFVGLIVFFLMAVAIPVFAEGEEAGTEGEKVVEGKISSATVEWGTSIAEATAQSVETGKPIMMDVYTDSWGSCKRLDAATFTDARIVAIAENFIPVKVNPEIKEQPENKKVQDKYGIRWSPAILFIAPDGGVIKNHSGYMRPDQFLLVMENVIKKEANFQEKLAKLKEMPDDPKLNRQIARLFLERQQIEKALPISEKMPDDVGLNRKFAIYYLGKNQFEKALLISEKMPDDVKLNNEFAMTYLKRMQIEKALPFSERVFENDPDNSTGLLPKLHLQIGGVYAMQIQRRFGKGAIEVASKAVIQFQKVIEMYPKSADYDLAQYYLGVTYSLNRQLEEATEVLEKLMNHTTNDRMKYNAEAALKRVQKLSEEAAAGETDN